MPTALCVFSVTAIMVSTKKVLMPEVQVMLGARIRMAVALRNATHLMVFAIALSIMTKQIGVIGLQNRTFRTSMFAARHQGITAHVSVFCCAHPLVTINV